MKQGIDVSVIARSDEDYLEYGRHVARHRRRRRAHAPTSNTASHDNHEKINSWVSFSLLYEYGVPLGGPSGRWSSASRLTETCSLGLPYTSLILVIHVIINWHLSNQGIRWPVSRDHIAGSSYSLSRSRVFLKLTAEQVLIFDWIAGSCQVNLLKTGQDCSEAG